MKKNLLQLILVVSLLTLINPGCKKEKELSPNQGEPFLSVNKSNGHLQQAKTFSSDVITTWLDMQLAMHRLPLPTGTTTQSTDRAMAYSGIAAYEAVVQGMPAYRSLTGQLTGFNTVMPNALPGKAYHWAASANAALAAMSRSLFPGTAQVNKDRINFVEDSLKTIYATEVEAETLTRSINFGKDVAAKVFAWALLDGSSNSNPPYVAPTGVGLWVPTSPTPAVNPYAYQRRLIVPGSASGTTLEPPPPYSTIPGSAFYNMVKDVYDVSQNLTLAQKAMADYFKDNPGYGPAGGLVAVFRQAIDQANLTLDQAAVAYAKTGMALHEAIVILFTNKYQFNTIRPLTYIRAVIDPAWSTYIPTPNHPEFPSGHATTNGAALGMMIYVFGDNFPMTLHVYDYLGYPSRPYDTFTQMGQDMANSRLYGGLHYRATCEKSIVQGRKIAENIVNTVKFKKD